MAKTISTKQFWQRENPPVHRSSPPVPAIAYLSLTLSMVLVGVYVGLSPLLVAAFPVMLLAWLRFAVAAVAMVHWLSPDHGRPPLRAGEHRLLFLQSLLGNFLFTLLALQGTWLAGAVSAGVVMAGIPACVALLSRVFLREPLNARVWWAAACTATAVTLLALQREPGASAASNPAGSAVPSDWQRMALGHLLLVGAMLCEASYVVIGKRLSAQVSARRVSAIINLWGLALSTPMGLWLVFQFDFGTVPSSTWGLLVFYALAASMVTVWLWMKGLRQVPAQQAGIFTVFLPLSSAAIGVAVLGEPWGTAHAVALMLALVAVFLVTQPGRSSSLPQPAEPAGPDQTPPAPGSP